MTGETEHEHADDSAPAALTGSAVTGSAVTGSADSGSAITASEVSDLRRRVAGPVVVPGDSGFEDEVSAWIRTFDHTPQVVVGATSSEDVVAAVNFAREHALPVRVQATGHGSHASITDGVLVVTKRMTAVAVDADAQTATIGAGAQWGAVIAAAAEVGLAPIAGSSPTVGAVGYLLGGGLGPLARSHGFSSDYIESVELVTADGSQVTASATDNPELFWALRGGKAGFGVVTQLRIRLVALDTLYAGSLMFDTDDIETALRGWAEYTTTAESTVTTSAAIVRMPDIPVIPEPIRGRTLLAIRFAYTGGDAQHPGTNDTAAKDMPAKDTAARDIAAIDAATKDTVTKDTAAIVAEGERLASPLRAMAPVYLDSLGALPAAEIARIHNDPTEPTVGWTLGRMFTSIDQDLVDALLDRVGAGREAPYVAIEIRHVGAATEADVPGGSAVGGRGARYTLSLIGAPNPALFAEVLPKHSSALLDELSPWLSAETTVNFLGYPGAGAWSAETRERLQRVRTEVDPDGLFVLE